MWTHDHRETKVEGLGLDLKNGPPAPYFYSARLLGARQSHYEGHYYHTPVMGQLCQGGRREKDQQQSFVAGHVCDKR